MIISASRRTDIPAFYSDWFFNRIQEKYVLVRNPMNYHQISKISLKKVDVDCIVFWTKNPKPMLKRLNELEGYNYYFQFTLNPYNSNIERSVAKKNTIIDTFKELSKLIGSNRVIWRYDPILLSPNIDLLYHIKYFDVLASLLENYTSNCVISFLDDYKRIKNSLKEESIHVLDCEQVNILAQEFSKIGKNYGMKIQTCAEKYELDIYGISHGACIDSEIISEISNKELIVGKDKFQREECGCIESIDIGEYNTCIHNCVYCYANYSKITSVKKSEAHISTSPLLIGDKKVDDIINERGNKKNLPLFFDQ